MRSDPLTLVCYEKFERVMKLHSFILFYKHDYIVLKA